MLDVLASHDPTTHAGAVVLVQHSEVWASPKNCPLTNQRLKARKLFCCIFVKQPNRDEEMSDLRRCLAAHKACGTFGLRTELAETTSVASDFSAAFHRMNASSARPSGQ